MKGPAKNANTLGWWWLLILPLLLVLMIILVFVLDAIDGIYGSVNFVEWEGQDFISFPVLTVQGFVIWTIVVVSVCALLVVLYRKHINPVLLLVVFIVIFILSIIVFHNFVKKAEGGWNCYSVHDGIYNTPRSKCLYKDYYESNKNGNPGLCYKMIDFDMRPSEQRLPSHNKNGSMYNAQCWYTMAIRTGNKSYCDSMHKSTNKNGREREVEECRAEAGGIPLSLRRCTEIKNDEEKLLCLDDLKGASGELTLSSFCREFGYPILMDKCYLNLVSHEPSLGAVLCSQISTFSQEASSECQRIHHGIDKE